MIAVLLAAVALAAEPPAPPERAGALEGQCPRSVGLVPGRPVPPEIVDEAGLVRCSAVAVPTSDLADLLATEAWAHQVADRYRLDVGRLEAERDVCTWEIAQARAPIPWYQTRTAGVWQGRIECAAAVGLTAWALDGRR